MKLILSKRQYWDCRRNGMIRPIGVTDWRTRSDLGDEV